MKQDEVLMLDDDYVEMDDNISRVKSLKAQRGAFRTLPHKAEKTRVI